MAFSSSQRNLILIGFRGTGKTTISTKIAQSLDWKRFSTDDMAMERCGMSIAAFVGEHGWAAFRQIEHECVAEVASNQGVIIDCGGGVVENPENMRLLSQNGIIVWVHAELNDVLERLSEDPLDAQRPLLTQNTTKQQDIIDNYSRRLPLYEGFAEFMVNTSSHSVEECCRYIQNIRNKEK
jgi:shikimate kinase